MEKIARTSDRLKEAMRDADKKQVDLVRDLGLNKSAVSRYMSGEYEPKQDAMLRLAAYLDVSEMWLWGYDVPKARPAGAKKNDRLAELVVRMRRDSDFFEVVSDLADLPQEQYDSIKHLLAAFAQKEF